MTEKPIPLFTSLPPRMKRPDGQGGDIGDSYARACIDSWIDCGFAPVTVNAAAEVLPDSVTDGVTRHVLDRDAGALYGKPLPYLSDMIAQMKNADHDVVALTNADILLRLSKADMQKIRDLRPGQCIVGNRMDIAHPDAAEGDIYPDGLDFFAFHRADLPVRFSDDFVFGVPWWDHALPLWGYLMGLEAERISHFGIVHLSHEERWNAENWVSVGGRFVASLDACLPETARAGARNQAYIAEVQKRSRRYGFGFLLDLARFCFPEKRRRVRFRALQRLSYLNTDTIAGWQADHADTRQTQYAKG